MGSCAQKDRGRPAPALESLHLQCVGSILRIECIIFCIFLPAGLAWAGAQLHAATSKKICPGVACHHWPQGNIAEGNTKRSRRVPALLGPSLYMVFLTCSIESTHDCFNVHGIPLQPSPNHSRVSLRSNSSVTSGISLGYSFPYHGSDCQTMWVQRCFPTKSLSNHRSWNHFRLNFFVGQEPVPSSHVISLTVGPSVQNLQKLQGAADCFRECAVIISSPFTLLSTTPPKHRARQRF